MICSGKMGVEYACETENDSIQKEISRASKLEPIRRQVGHYLQSIPHKPMSKVKYSLRLIPQIRHTSYVSLSPLSKHQKQAVARDCCSHPGDRPELLHCSLVYGRYLVGFERGNTEGWRGGF